MISLLGFSSSSIYDVMKTLQQNTHYFPGYKPKFMGWGAELPTVPSILLIPGIEQAKMRLNSLLDTQHIVMIFDNPSRLAFFKPIQAMDYQEMLSYKYKFFRMHTSELIEAVQDAIYQDAQVYPDVVAFELIPNFLKHSESTITGLIRNYLYSMQNTEHRSLAAKLIYTWLVSDNATLEELQGKLCKYTGLPEDGPKGPLKQLLDEFRNNPKWSMIKTSLNEARLLRADNKAVDFRGYAKRIGVPEFDLRYILTQSKTVERLQDEDTPPQLLNDIYRDRVAARAEAERVEAEA